MADEDRDRRGVPEAAPSERVLADQVEDVLSAIRAEIGDEEEPLDGRERRPSRPSIPDFLAAAIVFVEPSSPVDAWARGEDPQRADDDHDDYREIVVRTGADETRADDAGSASSGADATEADPAEVVSTRSGHAGIATVENDDGPATLRPSEVSFPPYRPSRRWAMRWIAAAVSVAAVGGLLGWKLAPGTSPEIAIRGLSKAIVAPGPQAAAPTTGSLSFTISTAGAQITIDGEPRGASPIELAPGTHTIRVEAPGYQPHERSVTIEAGATVALGEVALEAMLQRVIIEVEPKNAYVMITRSGELSGRRYAAPWPRIVEVEPGHYTVVAFRNGLETVLRPVEVRPGSDPVAVRIRLPSKDIYD